MKRETLGLAMGAIVVATIIMNTNTVIGDSQIASAISQAQSVKIEHKVRPVAVNAIEYTQATPIAQAAPSSPDGNTETLKALPKNFRADSMEVSRETALTLQRFLSSKGFLDQKYITGKLGPRTKQAVIEFQKAKGLDATGYVGDMTREKINSIIDGSAF